MAVRFFGSCDLTPGDLDSRTPALTGDKKGVPTGAVPLPEDAPVSTQA